MKRKKEIDERGVGLGVEREKKRNCLYKVSRV